MIQDRLDVLARTAALLGLDVPTRLAYTNSLSKLSSDHLKVKLHLLQLKKIEKELGNALVLARRRQTLAASWETFAKEAILDTSSLERQKNSMSAKAKEYQKELNIVASETPLERDGGESIMSLLSLQERVRSKEQDVKALKARLKAFEGLPPNLELAKAELARARENQIRLLNTREKLLGRMTQGLK